MATRWDRVPNLDEDVVRRTSEDVGKVKKRMNVESSGLKGGAKESVRDAGGRAASRTNLIERPTDGLTLHGTMLL